MGEILFSSLLVIIFTILLCIKISVRLTYEKETMILAGMAVDLAAFFLHTRYKVWNRRKRDKEIPDKGNDKKEEGFDSVLNGTKGTKKKRKS